MKQFLKKIKKDRISEYSAESAFFIILSIIPFTLVFISLIQYINIDKTILIYYAKDIIPMGFQEFALNIIEEIYSKSIATLSISILFTIFSASKGFFSIMKGINDIYNSEIESYIYNKIRSFLFTIIFILLLALTLIIIVLGNYLGNFLNTIFENTALEKIIEFVIEFRKMGLSIIIFLIFLFFYKLIPNYRLKLKNQIWGAGFVTISWYVISYGFSLYIELYKGFSLLYGSLATIILFMLWTYCLIYVILIGAEINLYFKN